MRTTYLRITFLFCFLLSIEGTISAQKFDWHGFYDVEENELAYILDIELDKQGNIYTSGGFTKTDFDIGPGVVARTANYGMDYFVTKYDSMGNWIWTITRGPNYILDDYITNIVIDEQNNIYAVGRDDDNFHDDSEFVLKLNSTGAVIWRKDFFIPDGMFQDAPVYF